MSAQLANVENLLGFLLTMQHRQLEYIPEGVNLENCFVKYAINPNNELEQLSHVLINNYPVSYNNIGQMLTLTINVFLISYFKNIQA